jgi:hypothetical protein
MDIGPIFFKEISCFDFLEEPTYAFIYAVITVWQGRIEEQDPSFPK